MADSYTHNTIKIMGSCQGNELIILIDSGSIYSFINEQVIKEIKAFTIKTFMLVVIVANGSMTQSKEGQIWILA